MVKCSNTMADNGGYALIAVMLTVVSLVSVVFAIVYPLTHRSKEQANTLNREISWQRFKHGLLGRQVEQAGGLYGGSPCYLTDMDYVSRSGGGTEDFSSRHVARRYYSYRSSVSDYIDEAPAWIFQNGFWYGYRGKHYVYPSPSDQWEEIDKSTYNADTCSFKWAMAVCQSPLKLYTNALFSTRERRANSLIGNMPQMSPDSVVVEIRDYGDDRGSRTSDNFRVVCGERGGLSTFFFPAQCDRSDMQGKAYTRYIFSLDYDVKKNYATAGLMKLFVQVKSGDTWVTRRTLAAVLPVEMVLEFGDYVSRGKIYLVVDYFG
jgi:hypothetical protein